MQAAAEYHAARDLKTGRPGDQPPSGVSCRSSPSRDHGRATRARGRPDRATRPRQCAARAPSPPSAPRRCPGTRAHRSMPCARATCAMCSRRRPPHSGRRRDDERPGHAAPAAAACRPGPCLASRRTRAASPRATPMRCTRPARARRQGCAPRRPAPRRPPPASTRSSRRGPPRARASPAAIAASDTPTPCASRISSSRTATAAFLTW